jgi:hypothetical protein
MLAIGTGKYAALLGQNLYGLLLCGAAYALGVAVESARARASVVAPQFFAVRDAA